MMIGILNTVRGTILYARAQEAAARGNIGLAKERIDDARARLGGKLSKPNMFDFHLRAAYIYFKFNDNINARAHIEQATQSIVKYNRLSEIDRSYLLDYCDLLISDIDNTIEVVIQRITEESYMAVTPRFLSDYPIVWKRP